ncbi:hypothetical protein D9758_000309 [Tetrapyrgos nigripes]|uniref:Isochorismatase-like domain-containing protein n=1 Tax=Tetrapyrgos nigripes TaxID=182062 RepID=A0A8H5LZ97_9AGAR|nr:hypothetical protein D9758_000309 [Tetrapyrgos nigripes]
MSMSNLPIHDTPILGMVSRPPVTVPIQYGVKSFWVEYPDGLLDLSRTTPLSGSPSTSPSISKGQLDIKVDGNRTIRVDASKTALVVIDMQNFFLHPDLRSHPTGLACVDPIMNVVPGLRAKGAKIVWVYVSIFSYLSPTPPSIHTSIGSRL